MQTDQNRPECVLVTGGAGFIGSNLIRWLLANDRALAVINLDALTYAGNVENLGDIATGTAADRHAFVHGNICDRQLVREVLKNGARTKGGERLAPPTVVFNLAAETHVDRSILDSTAFVSTNIVGTHVLLDSVREQIDTGGRNIRFVQVGTDEVYGALDSSGEPFTEESAVTPNSPYAASKAAADLLVHAYSKTYGLSGYVTRCSNNFGPFQFPEKLIPLMITRALSASDLPVYGSGMQIRDWLHVNDHASALWAIATSGKLPHRTYNIGGSEEHQNIEIVRLILAELGRPESLIRYVPDRPGHDWRYAIDSGRLQRDTGWRASGNFGALLRETIKWYVDNGPWWRAVQSEAYRAANAMYLAGQQV